MTQIDNVASLCKLDMNKIIEPYNSTLNQVIFIVISAGMAISVIALSLLILTAILFVEWRNSYKNQLLIQFMFARFLYTVVRFFSSFLTLEVVLFAYSEMALISWMFVFSRQMYLSLVKVFDTEKKNIWKMSCYVWIPPGVISFLLYWYTKKFYNSIVYCAILIVLTWPVLVANGVLLIIILKSVLKNKKNFKKNLKIILVTVVMVIIFCLQQIYKDIYVLIFIIVGKVCGIRLVMVISDIITMYQCACSILFWLFGNQHTRELWKFKKKDDKSILDSVSNVNL